MKKILTILFLMMISLALISAANSSQLNVSVSVSAETPEEEEGPSGSTGGGTTRVTGDEFEIENTVYKISIVQGETKTESLLITNLKSISKTLTISVSDELKDVVSIDSQLTLVSKETKSVSMIINSAKTAVPGLYLGVIDITDEKGNLVQVLVGIEVESSGALLDAKITLPQEEEIFGAGDKLLAEIELFNLGDNVASIDLEYAIKDVYGNIVLGEKQTIQVTDSLKFSKEFTLPNDIISGNYVIYITAKYDGKTAVSSKWFYVSNEMAKIKSMIATIIFAMVICYIIFMEIRNVYAPRRKGSSRGKGKLILHGYEKK